MSRIQLSVASKELDSLRLIALGRIPRCQNCPRYRALGESHRGRHFGRLPEVPSGCRHQVCAPLAHRHERASGRENRSRRFAS